jgi:hypothetical protein
MRLLLPPYVIQLRTYWLRASAAGSSSAGFRFHWCIALAGTHLSSSQYFTIAATHCSSPSE